MYPAAIGKLSEKRFPALLLEMLRPQVFVRVVQAHSGEMVPRIGIATMSRLPILRSVKFQRGAFVAVTTNLITTLAVPDGRLGAFWTARLKASRLASMLPSVLFHCCVSVAAPSVIDLPPFVIVEITFQLMILFSGMIREKEKCLK